MPRKARPRPKKKPAKSPKAKAPKKKAPKKAVARPKTKKAVARPKTKKAVAAPKKKAAARPKKKKAVAAPPEKKKAAREQKPPSSPPPVSSSRRAPFEPPRASERVIQVLAQLPAERALSDEERGAMDKVADTARRTLALDEGAEPEIVVRKIASWLDAVRGGAEAEPVSQDLALGIGVLWGEQLRAQVGWLWVHLSYPDGFMSWALVPDDRAYACFPLNHLPDLMKSPTRANTSVQLFMRIRASELPPRHANAYTVLG